MIRLEQSIQGALAVGVLGLLGWLLAAYLESRQALLSYLAVYLFWFGLSLGSLALSMLPPLTGGAWVTPIRPGLDAALRLLPLMALLFLPLGAGVGALYPWASPAAGAANPPGHWYLNVGFFQSRAAVYFIIWLGLAYAVSFHKNDSPAPARLAAISAPGLILCAITATFAAVDWVMSLVPKWHSAVFGLQLGVGFLLGALAFGIAGAAADSPDSDRQADRRQDLGNLLLMLVLAWSYLAFMQYLIVWIGNLPPDVAWYLPRVGTGWRWLGLAVVLFQCILPFGLLLFRRLKRNAASLRAIAWLVLAASFAQSLWLVLPSLRTEGFRLGWSDAAAMLGIGGLWLAAFLWQRSAALEARHG